MKANFGHLNQASPGPSEYTGVVGSSSRLPPSKWSPPLHSPLKHHISSTRLKVKRYTDGYPRASFKGYKTWRQADQAWQDVLDRRNAEWTPTPTAFQVQIDTTVQNDDLETVLSSSLEASSVSSVEHEEWWVLLEGDRPGVYNSLTDVREAEGTADRCVRQKVGSEEVANQIFVEEYKAGQVKPLCLRCSLGGLQM
ncbi:hypothetical protein BDN72DRAFT_903367 [Pluteus cervinus]|uniref:Uncharacterized protein n=1 Tax=Pluteus cervinus TaxID=181527 RepID=A0ACD3A9C5_9AGAR|nr:hypothetical protein BDN72DRAFT_903367 [Pluteus cervinus]